MRFAPAQSSRRSRNKSFSWFGYALAEPLLGLDSTTILLCLSMFEWARYMRTKGAEKLHLELDHQGFLPQSAVLSEGRKADVTVARQMDFPPGTMLVSDRGHEDHRWWRKLRAGGVNFVTRLKDSTGYMIMEQSPVPEGSGNLRDEVIVLASEKEADQPMRLRRTELWLEDKQDTIVFDTNNLKLAAATIAAIYRDRWQVELFFESSTWCTRSDAMESQGASALNCVLVGLSARFVRPNIAPREPAAESTVRWDRPAWPAAA